MHSSQTLVKLSRTEGFYYGRTRVFRVVVSIEPSRHPLENPAQWYRGAVFFHPTASAGTLDIQARLPTAFPPTADPIAAVANPSLALRGWQTAKPPYTLEDTQLKITRQKKTKKTTTMNRKKRGKKWRVAKARGKGRARLCRESRECPLS